MSPYQEYADQLRKAGFTPLPIAPNSKKPIHDGWTGFLENPPSDAEYAEWNQKYNSTHGVGVVTGHVIAVDVDFYEKDTSTAIAKMVLAELGDAPKRVGQKPKVLLVYRNEGEPFPKLTGAKFQKEGYDNSRVEVLAKGQQFIAYGTHKDTGRPYKYLGEDLVSFGFDFLEPVSLEQLESVLQKAEEIAIAHGWEKIAEGRQGAGGTLGLNQAVIEDVDFPLETPERVKAALRHIDASDYDTWIEIGQALHSTMAGQEAFEIWDEWSATADNYDAGQMESKWKSFRHVDGGVTIGTLYHRARIAGWIEEEEREERPSTQQGYVDRYWFMEEGSNVVDEQMPAHHAILKLQDFKNSHRNNFFMEQRRNGPVRVRFADWWMESPQRRTLRGETYIPKDKRFIGNPVFFNTYEGPGLELVPAVDQMRIQPFLDHVEYLCESQESRDRLLDWCAINVQRPDVKLPYAILLYSPHHGVGKGWFADVMSEMVGRHNASTCSAEQLSGQGSAYNEYMYQSVLTLVHEVRAKNRFEMTDRIKNLITEPWQHINLKYGAQGTKQVFNNFLFMSNHPDAMAITDEDRRVDIIQIDAEPRDAAYYSGLFAWLKDRANLSHLYTYLYSRDLTKFDPADRPEKTVQKQAMIDASKTELETILFDGIESADLILAKDIVQWKDIYKYMESEMYEGMRKLNASEKSQVRHALERFFMAKYPSDQAAYRTFNSGSGYQLRLDDRKVRVIVLRNVSNYLRFHNSNDMRYRTDNIRNEYTRVVDVMRDDL